MKDADISVYPVLVFREPEKVHYTTAGSNVARLRVPVSILCEPETILGYLPLPTRYQLHWKQLFTIGVCTLIRLQCIYGQNNHTTNTTV